MFDLDKCSKAIFYMMFSYLNAAFAGRLCRTGPVDPAGLSGGRRLALSAQLVLDLAQILEGVGELSGIPKQRGGVKDRGDLDPVIFKPEAVLFGNFKIVVYHPRRRNPPQTDDDLRRDEPDLIFQITDAGVLFVRLRVAVVRGAAFDNVGDIDLRAVEPDGGEHRVEQLAGAADERLAERVFPFAGPFADKHQSGVPVADAENGLMAVFTEPAFPALRAGLFQFVPIEHFVSPLL